jgi:hypothetical protein
MIRMFSCSEGPEGAIGTDWCDDAFLLTWFFLCASRAMMLESGPNRRAAVR